MQVKLVPQKLDFIQESLQAHLNDQIANKELQSKYGELTRNERLKNVLNWVFITFIIIASSIAIGSIGIRLLHLVLPPQYKWLTMEELQAIDKLFFSGAIGGFLVGYFKKANSPG